MCGLLAVLLHVASIGAAPASRATAQPPDGASALDAWAALRDAEAMAYRLADDGVATFSCRVRSSYLDRLCERGGPYEGHDLRFRLWWQAPGLARVTLDTGDLILTPEERVRMIGLIEPLHEILLPRSATRRLAGHAFTFAGAQAQRAGEVVIEARARDPQDERELAYFTIGAEGLVTHERTRTRRGEESVFAYRYEQRAGRNLPSGYAGSFRGAPVGVDIEWAAVLSGRPLPTRVVVRQAAGSGAAPEVAFMLTDHCVNCEVPPGLFDER